MARSESGEDVSEASILELPREEQLDHWRKEIATRAEDDPDRPRTVKHMAGVLADIHVANGETSMVFLREAIDTLSGCLNTLPEGHTEEGGICATLSDINRTAYETTQDLAYIEDAIRLARRALGHVDHTATPDLQNLFQARRAFHFALALWARYTSGDEAAGGKSEDMDQAITQARFSVYHTPSTDSEKSARLDYLCLYLVAKARRTGDFENIEQALWERQRHNAEDAIASGQNGKCYCGINILPNRQGLVDLLGFRYGQTHNDKDLESMIQIAVQAWPEKEFDVDNINGRATLLRLLADRANERYLPYTSTGTGRFNRRAAISLFYAHLEHIKATTVDILRQQNEALPILEGLLDDEWKSGGGDDYALEIDYVESWSLHTNTFVLQLDRTGRKEITEDYMSEVSSISMCQHRLSGKYSWLIDGAPKKPAHLHWTIPMLPGMKEGSYKPMEFDEDGKRKPLKSDSETEKQE